jgi:DNA-binding transcriptional LysR family regulator
MNIALRHLRAAVGVAEFGSFRRAAESVHLSQPALSLTISELEESLGVTLFDRTSRSVAVTELGASFVHGAARVLREFDELISEVGDIAHSRRGRVVVSCVSSIAGRVIPLAMRNCFSMHPQVEVVVRDDVAQQVLASVRSREADFGITVAPAEVGDDMLFEPLCEDRFHLVCYRTHRLAKRRTVAWRELDGECMVALSTNSGTHRMISDEFVRQGITASRTTPVSHLSTVHGMLEVDFGVAVLPQIALPIEGHPTLVSIPLVQPAMSRTVGAYRRRDRSLSPAAKAFLEAVSGVTRNFSG